MPKTFGTFTKKIDGTDYVREASTLEAAVAFQFDGWVETPEQPVRDDKPAPPKPST